MATQSTTTVETLKGSKMPRLPMSNSQMVCETSQSSPTNPIATISALAIFAKFRSSHTDLASRIGPVAANVKNQTAITGAEFSNLADARRTPARPAATGQPLTHYHSFFSELLSWNNPRASAIAYASVATLIFAVRYLDIIRYSFKLTWMSLGVTVLAEAAGKAILGRGLTSQLRPRKYFTISRESLDAIIGDVHELVNFFIIEAQRIFFAENVAVSAVAAFVAFTSYFLAKVTPYWGLALMGTTALFLGPLVYTSNQELIDHYLKEGTDIINSQTEQLRQVASKHTSQATEITKQYTSQATEITKQYVGDYTAKAQTLLHRGGSASPEPVKDSDFPQAPNRDFESEKIGVSGIEEPLAA